MATWADLEAAAPALAASGRRLIHARGDEALLASVRGDEPPRMHPINVGVVGGRLYAFVAGSSPKGRDLALDGRYAIHAHVDPAAPSEFTVRGHARSVTDAETRSTVAGGWPFEPDDGYALFELEIESALVGERGPDEWPPRYTTWRAPGNG